MYSCRISMVAFAIPTLAAGLFMAGCGESIEDNPRFKDTQKIVARLDDDSKNIARQVEDLSMTMETIKQDVREIKANPAAASVSLKDFDARLKNIENNLAGTQDAVKDKIASLAKMEIEMKKKGGSEEQSAASASLAAEPSADGAKKHTVKGRVTKSSETKAVASASPAKGGYYLVRDGDTAEKIASARGISVGTLLTANHLPQGGRLLPGQRVYVPGN